MSKIIQKANLWLRKYLFYQMIFLSLVLISIIIYATCYYIPQQKIIAVASEKSKSIKVDFNSQQHLAQKDQSTSASNADLPNNKDQDITVNDDANENQGNRAETKITKENSTPLDDNINIPKIAIIVTNLGISQYFTESALELPNNITLGFLPYVKKHRNLLEKADEKQYNILIQLPLEPQNYPLEDPGPFGVLKKQTIEENIKKIQIILDRFQNYHNLVGVYSELQESFSEDVNNITPILDFIKNKSLLFINGNYQNDDLVDLIQKKKFLTNNLIIDDTLSIEAILSNLDNLENIARINGKAIGYIRPYKISMDMLKEWLKTTKAKNIDIVPISAIMPKHTFKE